MQNTIYKMRNTMRNEMRNTVQNTMRNTTRKTMRNTMRIAIRNTLRITMRNTVKCISHEIQWEQMWVVCAKSEMADGVKVTLFRQWMHSEPRRISSGQKWDGWLVLPFCQPTSPILSFRGPPAPFYHFARNLFIACWVLHQGAALAKAIKRQKKGFCMRHFYT